MKRFAFAALSAFLFYAPLASAEDAPAMAADTAMGRILANAKGMTLYTFDNDMSGKSACNGACAANWPPLMAPAGAMANGDWTIIMRDDGSRQWAYKGKPLYAWTKDMKPGDATGDGFLGGKWHAAKP